jgi:hypothetical protein
MKKKILFSGVSALAVLALASCGSDPVPEGSYKKGTDSGTYVLSDYTETVDYAKLDKEDVDIYVNYEGESGITFRGASWFNSIDNKTYTQGSLLPTWARIAELTKTDIHEACGYTATSIDNAYNSIATAGYKSETDASRSIDLFYNSTDNLKKAGNSGTLVDLYPEIYPEEGESKMPYLKAYLDANPSIKQSIMVSGKHIYYTPYLDGNNDVENTFIMDTEILTKLFADADAGDTSKKNGGTNPDANVLKSGSYTPFITEEEGTVKVSKNGVATSYALVEKPNIITQQNDLLNGDGCTGKELLTQLNTYITEKYASLFADGKYESPADLYFSEAATYNTDELIALMRVIKANPGFITGGEDNEVEVFFPRGVTSSAIESIYDLAQLWGVQGVDSENGNYYFAADGTLNALETTFASYDVLNYISAIYSEGLILDNFDVSSATSTSTRYYDRFFKKVTETSAGYGFMMYDDPSIIAQANESEKANTKGIRSVLPPRTYWATAGNTAKQHLYDENGATITTNKTLTRYYESNRSLQTTSWSIPTSADNKEAALRIMDFMYSGLGQLIQNYGPEAYWKDSYNKETNEITPKATAELITGEEYAIISDDVRLELVCSQADFWSFMRGYIGATHGVGYVRLSGLNLQVTNSNGRVGLKNIENAILAGVLMHATSNAIDAATASQYTWCRSVHTAFVTSVTDTKGLWDSISEFWAKDKIKKNEGWVNLICTSNDLGTATRIYEGIDENIYTIKTATNGKKTTYKATYAEMASYDSESFWALARSLDDECIPSYAKKN